MFINETLDALRLGVCSLVYTKMDGKLRTAIGTLNPHLIPGEFHPKPTLVDMAGEICLLCDGQGTFQETGYYDDRDGKLHCTFCNVEIFRWVNKVIPKKTDPDLVHYFDLVSQGWRCFRLENLKSMSVNV